MGTAFATCFGYWFGIASLLWVICYVCNTQISMIQILNVLVSRFCQCQPYSYSVSSQYMAAY